MNTIILKKCLDELTQDKPNIDYVRGMLETLIEMQPVSEITREKVITSPFVPEQSKDEAAILDAEARAKLESIKGLNTEQ